MEGRTTMKANKGFTVIELAVVLAVIAVLAAILTPLVTSYIDQARDTRAQNDVRAIAQAFNLYRRDTGQYPIYANDTDADSDTGVEYLIGAGSLPSTSGGSLWTNLTSTAASLETYLNTNNLGLVTTARGGRVTYRGPYLDLITGDPWGNGYVVYAQNLERAETTFMGFVVSPGSDGSIETTRDQSGTLTVGGDDIVARIN